MVRPNDRLRERGRERCILIDMCTKNHCHCTIGGGCISDALMASKRWCVLKVSYLIDVLVENYFEIMELDGN